MSDVRAALTARFAELRKEKLLAGVLGCVLAAVAVVVVGGLLWMLLTTRGLPAGPTLIAIAAVFVLLGIFPLDNLFNPHRDRRPVGRRDPILLLFAVVVPPVFLRRNLKVLASALRMSGGQGQIALAEDILRSSKEAVDLDELRPSHVGRGEFTRTVALLREARLVHVDPRYNTCLRTVRGERLLQGR